MVFGGVDNAKAMYKIIGDKEFVCSPWGNLVITVHKREVLLASQSPMRRILASPNVLDLPKHLSYLR